MNKKFLIIDGDSFIHRAFHGYKKDKNSTEFNFLIKGFFKMITKELNSRKFDYLALVMDYQGDSFRKDIYPEYKGNRPKKTKEFLEQVEEIHEYIRCSGLPYLCMKGVEGDDVIGFLAKKAQLQKWETVILTGDKDMAQVIDENTKLIDTRFKKEINLLNLEETFGIKEPNQIIDFLALQGDKADNIIGLDGCGEKTAIKIINEYGSVENILKASEDDIYDKIRKTVRSEIKTKNIIKQIKETPDKLLLAKTLTTLKTDLDFNLTLKDIKINRKRFNREKIIKFNEKYGLYYKDVITKEIIEFF